MRTATQTIFVSAGAQFTTDVQNVDDADCWLCGGATDSVGIPKIKTLKRTFTDLG